MIFGCIITTAAHQCMISHPSARDPCPGELLWNELIWLGLDYSAAQRIGTHFNRKQTKRTIMPKCT